MTRINGGELREWIGIELALMYDKGIEWEHIFGEIKEIENDYWFIGNPNQHSTPIKLLTAEIKEWNPHERGTYPQDKLRGKGLQEVFSAGDGRKLGYNIIEYLIDKEVKKPRFSEGLRTMGVTVD